MTITTHTCTRCAVTYECNEWEPTFACPTCDRELCPVCHALTNNAPHLMNCEVKVLADNSMRPKDYCCSGCAGKAAKAYLHKRIARSFTSHEDEVPDCYLALLVMIQNYDWFPKGGA